LEAKELLVVGNAEARSEGGNSRQNIVVHQAKLGRVVAQNPGGLLLRSKVERNSTIF